MALEKSMPSDTSCLPEAFSVRLQDLSNDDIVAYRSLWTEFVESKQAHSREDAALRSTLQSSVSAVLREQILEHIKKSGGGSAQLPGTTCAMRAGKKLVAALETPECGTPEEMREDMFERLCAMVGDDSIATQDVQSAASELLLKSCSEHAKGEAVDTPPTASLRRLLRNCEQTIQSRQVLHGSVCDELDAQLHVGGTHTELRL